MSKVDKEQASGDGKPGFGCGTWLTTVAIAAVLGWFYPITIPISMIVIAIVTWMCLGRVQSDGDAVHIASQIRCSKCNQLIGRKAAQFGFQQLQAIAEKAHSVAPDSYVKHAALNSPWAVTCPACGAQYAVSNEGYPNSELLIWQLWPTEHGLQLLTADEAEKLKSEGRIRDGSKLIHQFVDKRYDRDGEDMSREVAKRWNRGLFTKEEYVPLGKPEPCPGECGREYYPEETEMCEQCADNPVVVASQLSCSKCKKPMGRAAAEEAFEVLKAIAERVADTQGASSEQALSALQDPWAIKCPECGERHLLSNRGRPDEGLSVWQLWSTQDELAMMATKDVAERKKQDRFDERNELVREFVASHRDRAIERNRSLFTKEAYVPLGKPLLCLNRCGGNYYPSDSAICPKCGVNVNKTDTASDKLEDAFRDKNEQLILELCEQDPLLLKEHQKYYGDTWLQLAAGMGSRPLVDYFLKHGIDVNESGTWKSPIQACAAEGHTDLAEYLISVGARPVREAVVTAVTKGHLDILKLLIDNGGETDFIFGALDHTPLSKARAHGHEQIVEYLTALGAQDSVQPHTDDPVQQEIIDYVEEHIGPVGKLALVEMIPFGPRIAVYTAESPDGPVIFTTGMSLEAIKCPPEEEAFGYFELLMHLPQDWPLQPKVEDPQTWPRLILRTVAHGLHARGSHGWRKEPVMILSEHDPPQPMHEATEFSGLLLRHGKSLPYLESKHGRVVSFATLVPIYAQELLYSRENGLRQFVEKFEEQGVEYRLVPGRPSVAQ